MNAWTMGHYAAYVWPAYAIALGGLLVYAAWLKKQLHRTRKQLLQWYKDKA